MVERRFEARWLGRCEYGEVHALQREVWEARARGAIGDTLLLVEHDAVITLGRSAHGENIVLPSDALVARGVAVHATGRGGDVTYHGPGQLVAYPVFDLKPDRCDVRKYVRDLATVMVRLCNDVGIEAGDNPSMIGAWVDLDDPRAPWSDITYVAHPAKIGAIGVRLSRWITMHGFAFNVSTRLSDFDMIVPCGIREYPVTSLAALGVHPLPTVRAVADRAVAHFESVFLSQCADFRDESGALPVDDRRAPGEA